MYKILIRPLLFCFDAEKVHHFTFRLYGFLLKVPGFSFFLRLLYQYKNPKLEREIFGLKFPNPVGLAAGFDKDGKIHEGWGNLGFGFVEIGTVTPRPQVGNPKKRLFRIKQDKAILNRMGFNNKGVEAAALRLRSGTAAMESQSEDRVIVGGNIGKNKDTANENAVSDYLECMKALHPCVDYFVVNVSSPNTPGLRELQDKEPLKKILLVLGNWNRETGNPKPLLLKIAPDLSDEQLDDIVEIVNETKLDGIVATNTTLDRSALTLEKEKVEALGAGGISGAPLTDKSTEIIRKLSQKTGGKLPIIGVGGIMTPEDAWEKIQAGACLVQIYTGFIYEGPAFPKRINKFLVGKMGQSF